MRSLFSIDHRRRRVWAEHLDAMRFAAVMALASGTRQQVVQVRADNGRPVGWHVRRARS